MSLKTIKVNPIFLSSNGASGGGGGGGGGSSKTRTRKEKPVGVSLGAANNIKKKLMHRIKNFQQEQATKNTQQQPPSLATQETFSNEFSTSMQFLDDLAQNKQDRRHNATLKKKQTGPPTATQLQIATELPPELDWNNIMPAIVAAARRTAPAPVQAAPVPVSAPAAPAAPAPAVPAVPAVPVHAVPVPAAHVPVPAVPAVPVPAPAPMPVWQPPPAPSYGNLKKGGIKPTYRTWLRTTQKVKPVTISNTLVDMPLDIMPAQAQAQLEQAQAPAQLEQPPAQLEQQQQQPPAQLEPQPAPAPLPVYKPTMPKRKRITRTLKYKLGKHANGTVSVLIKNAQTRRKIQTEQAELKQKSILDVKNFLRTKNLIKVGSAAPNDVLRQIYEQSILAGQVENKASDTLIHNFFNEEKK